MNASELGDDETVENSFSREIQEMERLERTKFNAEEKSNAKKRKRK
jgi:hypothetical protein